MNSYQLPQPSLEQQEILKGFEAGYNIKVEAVAGAGKTTTLLMCANLAAKSGKRSIIVTFNKSLKDEIKHKVTALSLNSFIKVYTYHGAATKIYGTTISNDLRFISALNEQEINFEALNSEVFMIDEAQDITDHIYKFLTNNLGKIADRQILVVGDEKQCINAFRGAKVEYLTNCTNLFKSSREWISLPLRVSYRITPEMAAFINNHLVDDDVLVGGNNGSTIALLSAEAQSDVKTSLLPEYIIGSWAISSIVKEAIAAYGCDQVAILSSSVKSTKSAKSPLGRLVNSNNGILYYIMDPEQESIDDNLAKNKVLICSFNAMKGREKDCIILMSYDESYFKYFEKSWGNKCILPNVLYVAATRARKKLIIIQDANENPLRTIKLDKLMQHCKCSEVPTRNAKDLKLRVLPRDMAVTELLKHRDVNDLHKLMTLVTIVNTENVSVVNAPNFSVNFENYAESVHKYYCKAILLYVNIKMYGNCKLISQHMLYKTSVLSQYDMTIEKLEKIGEYKTEPLRKGIDEQLIVLLNLTEKSPRDLMKIIILLEARNRQYHILTQITNFDWVNEEFIVNAGNMILQTILNNGQFEVKLTRKYQSENFRGVADYIEPNGTIWSFKCSNSDVQEENNILQLAGYLAILGGGNGKIYNIITGKITAIKIVDSNNFLQLLHK